MAYDDGGVLHVGNTVVSIEQNIMIGDKLFLRGFDKPVIVQGKEYKGSKVHFYGQMKK